MEKFEIAEKYLLLSIELDKKVYGGEKFDISSTYNNLG